jgi:hypothetical protein
MPGWTRCLGIVVPPRITKNPLNPLMDSQEKVKFIAAPLPGKKIVFNIIFSHKAARPEHLIQKSPHKIEIHGCIQMPEELVWLVSFEELFLASEEAVVRDYFNKLKIHLKSGSSKEGRQRAFLHVIEEAVMPFIIDIELGKENLEIDGE